MLLRICVCVCLDALLTYIRNVTHKQNRFLAGPVTATLKVVEPMSLLMVQQSKASNYSLEQ